MTYRRRYAPAYISGMKNFPDDSLRIKIRSMTTMLAGNPHKSPSIAIDKRTRAIDVNRKVVLVYKFCPGVVLEFVEVIPYSMDHPYDEDTYAWLYTWRNGKQGR